jgi:simple sugar transport system permease protein
MIGESVAAGLLLSTFRFASPLALAAIAGMFSERSGLAQIALEGFMLFGAFAGAVTAFYFQNGVVGLFAAMIAGMLAATFFALMTIQFKSDQIVSGTIVNMLAWGGIPVMSKFLFDSSAQTPTLSLVARNPDWLPLAFAILTGFFAWHLMNRTSFGLRISFAGEKPEALKAVGINVRLVRFYSVLLTGALAGLGGGMLSTALSSSYTRNMVAGRGFMALAALILGKWRPLPAVIACLFFGGLEVAQLKLQGVAFPLIGPLPAQLVQIIPYLATLLLIAGIVGESKAPRVLGSSAE